jgi:hypothetical protein
LDSKQWYAERGIPFRRGYLLVSFSWSQSNCPRAPNPCRVVRGSWHRQNLDNPQSSRGARSRRLHHHPFPFQPRRQRTTTAHL